MVTIYHGKINCTGYIDYFINIIQNMNVRNIQPEGYVGIKSSMILKISVRPKLMVTNRIISLK